MARVFLILSLKQGVELPSQCNAPAHELPVILGWADGSLFSFPSLY